MISSLVRALISCAVDGFRGVAQNELGLEDDCKAYGPWSGRKHKH